MSSLKRTLKPRNLRMPLMVLLTAALSIFVWAVGDGASAQAIGSVKVIGYTPNHSSVRVYYQPVDGARDYRVYDVDNPHNVKYAGLTHLSASASCPGPSCRNHFVTQPDGATPVFPYQVAPDGSGGPQALDVPGVDIEWNSVGDFQPHSLIVEAVDQLGPVPGSNLYTGVQNVPIVDPRPAGAMLGSNKGPTDDGNVSTNGQGPYSNQPRVIARSEPFVAQANRDGLVVPSAPEATQVFLDTFENGENSSIQLLARQDDGVDAYGNLGSMTYSMNVGTSKEWSIEFRQTDNVNSMPFVAADHFMDMVFDGATPNTSAPTHTIYGSMSMTPSQTLDISGGKVAHLTMEVDAHQSFRRWVAFDIAPAADPLQAWNPGSGHPVNNSDQAIFLELREAGCTLDIFNGATNGSDRTPTGTAGGAAHGARLWGQAGSVGGAPIFCGTSEVFDPQTFTRDGLGLDDRTRFDLFLSANHIALFADGRLMQQSDIPEGSFGWANAPLKAYYSHYLYHSDADQFDLQTVQVNGDPLCYPENAYWFNDPSAGTASDKSTCNRSYPAGYGFPHSDERHWDNMGFEVLPPAYEPANRDFSMLTSLVAAPPLRPVP